MTLYVVRRVNKSGNIHYGCSAPCTHCMRLIKESGIKKIKYMDWNNNLISMRSRDYFTNHISTGRRIMRQEFAKKNIKYSRTTMYI